MNIKSEKDRERIIKLFVEKKYSCLKISRIVGFAPKIVKRIVASAGYDYLANSVNLYTRENIVNRVEEYFLEHNSLRKCLAKFVKNNDIVYDVFYSHHQEITDDLILYLFLKTDKKGFKSISTATLGNFKSDTKSVFKRKTLDYIRNRYSDSESLNETISRIYNKIETKPICKQCGRTLKYMEFASPFQMFCSKKCANSNEETKRRLKETCLKKYGCSCSSKAESVKKKYRDHMEKKYGSGIVNAFQAKEIIEKSRDTKLKKYGSSTYNNRVLSEKTCLKKYGVRVSSQNVEVKRKANFRYNYDGRAFDSMPEIAFYVWLNDVKNILDLDFEYSPNKKFEYYFNGKQHSYMVDFRVEDQYFEIKGDHFFKDGKMINPFRHESWSDERYNLECAMYEAKHQCMLKNGVHILKNSGYQFFVDYVSCNYGRDYLTKFRNRTD